MDITRTRLTGGAAAADDMRAWRPDLGCRSDMRTRPPTITRRFLEDLKLAAPAADVLSMTPRDGAGGDWLSLPAETGNLAPAGEPRADAAAPAPGPSVTLPVDLPTLLRDLEDAYIRAALAHTQCNKKEAAKLLGMGRTTLVEKLRRRNLAASRSSS
jgi:DNA-binding NtrC family response regulator